jgi:hypothetical protein
VSVRLKSNENLWKRRERDACCANHRTDDMQQKSAKRVEGRSANWIKTRTLKLKFNELQREGNHGARN